MVLRRRRRLHSVASDAAAAEVRTLWSSFDIEVAASSRRPTTTAMRGICRLVLILCAALDAVRQTESVGDLLRQIRNHVGSVSERVFFTAVIL